MSRWYHNSLVGIMGIISFSFLFSCLSIDNTAVSGDPSGEPRPEWVNAYPADHAYFIGIGSSNSGNKAEDSETARLRALRNLAGEISARIESEITVQAEESGGIYRQRAEEALTQRVEQDLELVETVDSWYAPSEGYWYYLRLNRAEWEALQAREMQRAETRVEQIVQEARSGAGSLIDRINLLQKGWSLLVNSPYQELIRGEWDGSQGLWLDLIENRIRSHIDAIRLELPEEPLVVAFGRPLGLSLKVLSRRDASIGRVPLVLKSPQGRVLQSFSSDVEGSFSGELSLPDLSPGAQNVVLELEREAFALPLPDDLNWPRTQRLLNVESIPMELETAYLGDNAEAAENRDVEERVMALFNSFLPIKFTPNTGDEGFRLSFQLYYRDAPPNAYGFTILYVSAAVAIERGTKTITTFKTEEFKGAGLNWSQANQKALDKLFDDLQAREAFSDAMKEAFRR